MKNNLTTEAKEEIIKELHELFEVGQEEENQKYLYGIDFSIGWLSAWLAGKDVGTSEDVLKAIERGQLDKTKDYRRIAEDYDTTAFINGRDISTDEIISYVSDNMRWVEMDAFMKSVMELISKGNPPADSLLVALIDYAKYPEINLRELDVYLEV